ncbi:Sulfoquinovosyl transferase SQD2 [Gracilariopsis chorda]|uniref:Sulfoquinovosyl transferase SQD2 n=1 Tax=Gracilariopsis chorda TaxID=448386 RepID=A0A2V3IX83_9FLOR|nr:Sulfoquinovosyl transferase SQD2 [Gracilariopsis chorda]|eukprot:PXF46721.1 Sulfoquinovosyl transferase SQD2 [Gracilariopsis chorda]
MRPFPPRRLQVHARADTGTTPEEAVAAATARHSYAVADGNNLQLTATPPRKIALLVEPSPFTHTSGYSNRFKNLILQLRQAGDDVLVVVPDNDPNAPTEFAGATIVNVPGFRFPLYRRITLTLGLRGVYRALKQFDPDVIHLTTPGFLIFSTLLYARLLRKAILLSYHTHLPIYAKDYGLGTFQGVIWTMLRLQHNRADFTLTTSPQLCEELVENGFERVGLWRKGIDTHIFNPKYKCANMRHQLTQGNPQDPLLIYVGRIGAEKNLIFFKQLMARFPHCRLALVGDGPYKHTLQKELAGTKTVFTGILHGETLSRAFASADVFVMPSESETLGFVVLESMASGVPVVGADAGGIPDIINDGENGFLFSRGSHDECANRVERLLGDGELRARMGQNARDEALKWSWRASAAATRNVGYGRAISNFKYRAMGGLGLPRSLTWLRWIRVKLAMLKQRLFGRLLVGLNAH